MKILFIGIFGILFLLTLCTCNGQFQHEAENGNGFSKIYPLAIQGDIKESLAILDSISDDSLSYSQKRIKSLYIQRFRNQNIEDLTENKKVNQFIAIFQRYWINSLMKNEAQQELDSKLEKNLVDFLMKQNPSISIDALEKEIKEYSEQFLKKQGFYSNAFGRTAHLYDLFIWEENDLQEFEVKLITNSIKVHVNIMTESILKGWVGYATFNRSHAGGWTTREALYVFMNTYDQSSENFKISYLSHEGQHFQDYIDFPKLTGRDLEYRAKLVELILLEDSFWQKLESFIQHAAPILDQPHPFANHTIISHLSKEFFQNTYEKDMKKWKAIGLEKIKNKCEQLLDSHTKTLQELGSETVESYISTM